MVSKRLETAFAKAQEVELAIEQRKTELAQSQRAIRAQMVALEEQLAPLRDEVRNIAREYGEKELAGEVPALANPEQVLGVDQRNEIARLEEEKTALAVELRSLRAEALALTTEHDDAAGARREAWAAIVEATPQDHPRVDVTIQAVPPQAAG